MSSIENLADRFRTHFNNQTEGIRAELGKLNSNGSYTVRVPGTDNEVYARIEGHANQVVTAINNETAYKARLPVRIRLNTSGRFEVMRIDPIESGIFGGEAAPTLNLPPVVGDALNVILNTEQFRPGRIRPLNGTDLQVFMELLAYEDKELGGVSGDLATAVGTIGVGKKAPIVISVDPATNTLTATKGTDVSIPTTITRGTCLAVSIPAGHLKLWAYIIQAGATVLPTSPAPGDAAFSYDLRQWITLDSGATPSIDATDVTYTPDETNDWPGTDPTTGQEAWDYLAARMTDVEAGAGIIEYIFPIDQPKASADTPDDDFDASSLDAKWTAVAGSTGTVDLLGTSGGIYDLTTRPGDLLVQLSNGNNVRLRQDYTLPDGSSIVFAFTPGHTGAISADELQVWLTLNDNNTSEVSGTFIGILLDTDASAYQVQSVGTGSANTATANQIPSLGGTIYLRIARATLTYYVMWSTNGLAWVHLESITFGGALDNVWIAFTSAAATGTPTPIIAAHFLRQGTNGIDPW